ncbi:hypothetical protein EON65_04695 [archaeon]|nr:MAG: hypothetical protein EON65_04695 [archaeon]
MSTSTCFSKVLYIFLHIVVYFKLIINSNLNKGESERKLPRLPKKLRRMQKLPGGGAEVARKTKTLEDVQKEKKAQKEKDQQAGKITFTEFLRVNMRLAEDRILSFVCVFSTGYGTKWIPGATFFYQPEIRWQTLLTQRRRWLNGTFASFLFFFNSQRARTRITGGMFDSHKAGKNIRFVNALWSLQLMQLVLVLMAPAVFGSAIYIGESLVCMTVLALASFLIRCIYYVLYFTVLTLFKLHPYRSIGQCQDLAWRFWLVQARIVW